jgi:5-dehydro-4-deoxyglucarate dehydratase
LFAARLEWHLGYQPRAVFVAGGAGEFFSLTFAEYSAVVSESVAVANGRVPVIASAGFGTRLAVQYERAGP